MHLRGFPPFVEPRAHGRPCFSLFFLSFLSLCFVLVFVDEGGGALRPRVSFTVKRKRKTESLHTFVKSYAPPSTNLPHARGLYGSLEGGSVCCQGVESHARPRKRDHYPVLLVKRSFVLRHVCSPDPPFSSLSVATGRRSPVYLDER